MEILFPGNEDFSADKNIFSKYKFGGYYYDCVEKDYSFTTFAKFSEKLTFIAPWYAHEKIPYEKILQVA